jgi:acyl-coenzyme A thioesterase PaaI-like protein
MPDSSQVLSLWKRLTPFPGGRRVFSAAVGVMAPYAATIHPEVLELKPGHCRARMRERRGVRNPFHSVHAAALMCLAETTSGLAMATAIPSSARGIVVGFDMQYMKKARGILTAESSFAIPDMSEEKNHDVPVAIRNSDGEVVAQGTAKWLVGPRPPA